MNISWVDKVSNNDVLLILGEYDGLGIFWGTKASWWQFQKDELLAEIVMKYKISHV